MMHSVVLGGAGMVGSYLVPKLLKLGSVTVLDNFSRGRNKVDGAYYVNGDAGDQKLCREVFDGAEAVYNLAAVVTNVNYNQFHHVRMYCENMRLLQNPLLSAMEVGVPAFLQVSSVCVYAPEYNSPAIEENGQLGFPVKANAGYSYAKRMGEKVALWATAETDMKIVVVRPSNMFGKHDYFDEKAHVIPNMIKQCFNERPYIEVHGVGNTIREFLYAGDGAEGMIVALRNGESGQVYNLGTNGRTKINTRDLLRMIQHLSLKDKEWKQVNAGDTGDTERWSDCTKIEALGWKATTDMETGLREVINWYAPGL